MISLWAPVLLYMALIFGLSSITHPPEPPSGVSDKDLHILLYFGLGVLVVRALAGGWRRYFSLRTAVLAVIICVLYGASDEIHQHFVPPREMDALDVAADALGASLAAFSLFASRDRRR
jgi:VanZ family protein